MPMVRLIYTSVFSEACGAQDVRDILHSARKHNSERAITGMLCYDPFYFLQWLEGERAEVNELYHQIVDDPRHTNVTILDYSEVSERAFGDWSMAYINTGDVERELLFKYSPYNKFDPTSMSAEGVCKFMVELSQDRKNELGKDV